MAMDVSDYNDYFVLRSSHPEVFYKIRCSYKFCKIRRKTSVPDSLFLIKLQASGRAAVSINSFFTEHLWVTAYVS